MKPRWHLLPRHQPRREPALRWLALVIGIATAPMLYGSSARPLPVAPDPADDPPLLAMATLQDLMRYEVDANADPIWDAVGSTTSATGVEERQPHSDAEWEALRRHVVVLLEATNLLMIPGRKVAAKPFPAEAPGVLSSAQIQQRIDQHREQFNAHAVALRAIVSSELDAIDQHDANRLQALGEGMDAACESCHVDQWYPHEVIPPLPLDPGPPTGTFKPHAPHD